MVKVSIRIEIRIDRIPKKNEKDKLTEEFGSVLRDAGAEELKATGSLYREYRGEDLGQVIVLGYDFVVTSIGLAKILIELKKHSTQRTHIKIGSSSVTINNAKMSNEEIVRIIDQLKKDQAVQDE